MSMTKDMFMDEVERLCEQFCMDEISLTDGIRELHRIGFDRHEAETLLKESAA